MTPECLWGYEVVGSCGVDEGSAGREDGAGGGVVR